MTSKCSTEEQKSDTRAVSDNVLLLCNMETYGKMLMNSLMRLFSNCRFSHDVTKIQTTKLLILLIFYFSEV